MDICDDMLKKSNEMQQYADIYLLLNLKSDRRKGTLHEWLCTFVMIC